MDAVLSPDHKKRPVWPEAEFIVGNPPFIGKGAALRHAYGDDYVEALWAAHDHMNESADFVMYWWDRAAELLTRKATVLRRFGFVTTNSISQVFNRRVLERHLNSKNPISLVLAIPDHPWTKVTKDAAAVRIAMTVAEAGKHDGILREVVSETGLDSDTPSISFDDNYGFINSDLTTGADVTSAKPLKAAQGLSSNGVMLAGSGFIIDEAIAKSFGFKDNINGPIKKYRNGRDLTSSSRKAYIIDFYGFTLEEIRQKFPLIYQHLLIYVKPERDKNKDAGFR
jgi:hypothetical protein